MDYGVKHAGVGNVVKRLFGVLFWQLFILYYPCRLQLITEMDTTVRESSIIHNLVAEERFYKGTMKFRHELDAVHGSSYQNIEALTHDVVKEAGGRRTHAILGLVYWGIIQGVGEVFPNHSGHHNANP